MGLSLAERIARLPAARRARVLELIDDLPPGAAWALLARPEQVWPAGVWSTWLVCAGRGWGKTRVGSEAIVHAVRDRGYRRVGLVGRTAADVRDVMLGGPSGILTVAPANFRPRWEPSKRLLTWPNGATAHTYSADEPDQLRGPQHDLVWGDEIATWDRDTWDQVSLGLRVQHAEGPRAIVTTTPRPLRWLIDLAAERATRLTTGRYTDNAANLDGEFRRRVEARYAGTSLGRQELDGILSAERPGALWSRAMLDAARATEAPALARIVVAVDPAVTSAEGSDETGIIAAGVDRSRVLWVLRDRSGRLSPEAWARRAVELYRELRADRIVAEANQGGDLVSSTLRAVDPAVPVRLVHASRGKAIRAEPVAALYEQGRARHVSAGRDLEVLEDQLCSWAPGDPTSPDRLDALVWAATDLVIDAGHVGPMAPIDGSLTRDATPWAR